MKLIPFDSQTVVIAKDQPEYKPAPAHIADDVCGTVTVCWKLSFREALKLLFTRKIWHRIMTFHYRLQPQLLLTEKPDFGSITAKEFRTSSDSPCKFSE